VKIQLVRHATLWLQYAGSTLLVDPMFSDQGANPPIPNSDNDRRNPLVPLPGELAAWLRPDAVLVTHLHPDHWDEAAARALPKPAALFCQPGDKDKLGTQGFSDVTEIEDSATFRGITIHRTGGQHGTGEIGRRMGPVSGFVLRAEGEPTLYIAGDTIWCEDVRIALDAHKPDVTIVNAGGAKFVVGDAITMDADDVIEAARHAPYTKVVAVHMDTINHCHATRDVLRTRLEAEKLLGRVAIPEDGAWL